MSTLDSLKNLVQEKFGIDATNLDVDQKLSAFGLDSLAQVEFMFSIEDHFNINLPTDATNVDSLSGLAHLIDQLLPKADL